MTAQWVKYDGSDEQIADIEFACSDQNGVVLKFANGKQSRIFNYGDTGNIASYSFTSYLICNPHPYADMICQWARTGQPVYIRIDEHRLDGEWTGYQHYSTNTPDWNIPGAEYSFTPFGEEV